MNMPKIIIDSREITLSRALLRIGLEHETRPLVLGDIIIGDEWILERKTATDLARSLVDGRFEEQRSRLRAIKQARVGWLLEGEIDPDALDGGVLAAAVSLAMEFCVFAAANVHASSLILKKIARSLARSSSAQLAPPLDVSLVRKRRVRDAEEMCEAALSCITGIGPVRARAIALKHGSLHSISLSGGVSEARGMGAAIVKRVNELLGVPLAPPPLLT
jgi:ERCC4-type nuclease